jgi:hypothetical protein
MCPNGVSKDASKANITVVEAGILRSPESLSGKLPAGYYELLFKPL